MADFTLTATVKPEVDTDELQDQLDSGTFTISGGSSGSTRRRDTALPVLEDIKLLLTSQFADLDKLFGRFTKNVTEGVASGISNSFASSTFDSLIEFGKPGGEPGESRMVGRDQGIRSMRAGQPDQFPSELSDSIINQTDEEIETRREFLSRFGDALDRINDTLNKREFGDDDGAGGGSGGLGLGKIGSTLVNVLKAGVIGFGIFLANKARQWGDKMWGNFAQDAEQAIEDFVSKFDFVNSDEAKLIGDVADGFGKIFGGIATLDFKQVASGVMDVGGEITSLISSHLPQFKKEIRGLIDPFAETFSGFGGKFSTWIKSGLPQWAQSLLGISGSTDSGGSDSRQGTVDGRAPIFDRSPIGSGGLPQTEPEAQTGNTNPGGRDDARPDVTANITITGQSREEVRREIDRALDQFDKNFNQGRVR